MQSDIDVKQSRLPGGALVYVRLFQLVMHKCLYSSCVPSSMISEPLLGNISVAYTYTAIH
jgi:hypothetical protein